MKLASHPLWLVGFRPFFLLACIAGAVLPLLWALMFTGTLAAPAGRFTPVQWHAHEMFFGFGWAVLGGFLLTATKNWVQVRGYHGPALVGLASAWCLERVGMAWGGSWPAALFWFSNTVFLGSIVAMLLWTLLRYRQQDSYRDNILFLVVLPVFLVAKLLILDDAHFHAGVTMVIGLFRVAFLVMLERTLSQFMKGAFQVTLLRAPRLDAAIKLLALGMVFQAWLPVPLATGLAVLLAVLLMLRFVFWYPLRGMRRIELGVMYLGYLGIVLQLLLVAAELLGFSGWVGSVAVHVFSFGVMGLIIPAMLVRISKGHTGRKVNFDAGDRLLLWIMLAAFVVRIVLPQLAPGSYRQWILLAAGGWGACFVILGLRLAPRVIAPRVDGREH